MESALIPVGSITSVNVGGRVSSCAKISGLNKKPRLCGRGEFEMTVGERRYNSPNCWNVQGSSRSAQAVISIMSRMMELPREDILPHPFHSPMRSAWPSLARESAGMPDARVNSPS